MWFSVVDSVQLGLTELQFHEQVYSIQLVQITPISLWFMVDISIVFMGFKNQHSHHVWGVPLPASRTLYLKRSTASHVGPMGQS